MRFDRVPGEAYLLPGPRKRRRLMRHAGAFATLLALVAAACSDSSTIIEQGEPAALPEPGASPGDATETPPAAGNVYAMTVHAFGPDITTSYLVTLQSVDEGSVMDLDTAIELPAFANVAGIAGEPFVWLGYGGEPTLERWDLRPDGRLEPGPRLNFANLGASEVSPDAQGAFISMDLAAVPNQQTGELIFWNPTTMEIVGTLNLEIPARDGIPPLVRSTTPRADGSLVLSYYYISPEGEFADGAGIVVVDPSGPSVIARDEWAGCDYNYARATDDGTIYLTVGAQWIQRRLIYADGPYLAQPCLLRILPGATEFDRDFDPNTLAGLSGGRAITGNLEPVNAGEAFFVAWQEELMGTPFTPENYDDVRGTTAAFKWYHWDMASGQATEVPGDPFAALPTVYPVDGRQLYSDQRLAGDDGGLGVVPFYELTPSGSRPAFTGFGTTWKVLRLR
jgi:hypothetical protein